MAKNALVISGGGAKGSFAVGVLKYILLNKPDIKFDIICGTSTGALITPYAALGNIAALERIYTTMKTEDIILKGDLSKRIIMNNSLFDVGPLVNVVRQNYPQNVFDSLMTSNIQVFFASVCLQTGKVVHFSNKDMIAPEGYDVIKLKDWDEMIRAIVASADQPVFTPPIKIRSTDAAPRQYVDGGVREYAPIRVALDNGATDIYVVYLSPEIEPEINKEYTSVFDILLRTLALFSDDVGENDVALPRLYNKAVVYLNEVKKNIVANSTLSAAAVDGLFDLPHNPFAGKKLVNMKVFHPDYILKGMGGLEFNPVEMKKYLDHGFDVAKKHFEQPIEEDIFT
jgi:predicted acylesterase/phospholipase RssA